MQFSSQDLRRIRREKGLTQEELATHVGVTRQTIINWEKDRNPIPITPQLAYALGLEELARKQNTLEVVKLEGSIAGVAKGLLSQISEIYVLSEKLKKIRKHLKSIVTIESQGCQD